MLHGFLDEEKDDALVQLLNWHNWKNYNFDFLDELPENYVLVNLAYFVPKEPETALAYRGNRLESGKFIKNRFGVPYIPLPLVKVIHSFSPKYESGSIWSVPIRDVHGVQPTARGIFLTKPNGGTNMKIVENPNEPDFILAVDDAWGTYRFKHPLNLEAALSDRFTFLLPSLKLQCKINFEKLLKQSWD